MFSPVPSVRAELIVECVHGGVSVVPGVDGNRNGSGE